MKRDATIAAIVVVAVAAVCYGLTVIRPPVPPSVMAAATSSAAAAAPAQQNGHVIMRVNGEAITQSEFEAAMGQVPEELRAQFESAPGRRQFAEQLIRLKILEQEGRRLGIESDPDVAAQLAADRMNIIARAAAEKVVGDPSAQAVQAFYKENAGRFQTLDVSHILIAYEGGSVRPRSGGRAPSQAEAANRAQEIYRQLQSGADFAALARKTSDDPQSAQRGGHLGVIGQGMLPAELEARVWAIPPGQISNPILSPLGVHIFRVNSRGTAPLPQVSAGIARHVKQKQMFDRVEVLRRNAKVDFDPQFFPGKKPS